MNHNATILLARAVADDRGVLASPGAVGLVWRGDGPEAEVLAVGGAGAVRRAVPARAREVDLGDAVLIPGLVNAHCHLDLSSIGPIPLDADRGFAGWLADVRAARPADPAGVLAGVRLGVERSLAGGVVAVGDIAGAWSAEILLALRKSPLVGVSYLECFGLGDAAGDAGDRLERIITETPRVGEGVQLGIQPHAPYSAGLGLYARAVDLAKKLGAPLSTHLAESSAERALIADGAGPMRELLESLGVWNEAAAAEFGGGRSPVRRLRTVLERGGRSWSLAHVNDVSDDDLALIARAGVAVVYCPRSSEFFDRSGEVGPHRWREMLARGIPVALGTDSAASLGSGGTESLSVLNEARLLYARGDADPRTLLAMMTVHGARALGLPEGLVRFTPGPVAGMVAIESVDAAGPAIEALLGSDAGPRLLTRHGEWPASRASDPASNR